MWTIVGATESDRAQGKLSVESPVGKALLDHAPGATVEFPVVYFVDPKFAEDFEDDEGGLLETNAQQFGGLFNTIVTGHGTVAVTSDGPPMLPPVLKRARPRPTSSISVTMKLR